MIINRMTTRKTEQGSALIYVLIVIMLLALMGTILVAASMTGYRQMLVSGGATKAFYLNDAAIEESLAEIDAFVFRAERIASEYMDGQSFLDTTGQGVYKRDDWNAFMSLLDQQLAVGTITEEDVPELMERALSFEFERVFYAELLDGNLPDQLVLVQDGAFVTDPDIAFPLDNGYLSQSFIDERLRTIELDYELEEGQAYPSVEDITTWIEDRDIKVELKTAGMSGIYNKGIDMTVDIIVPTYEYATKTYTSDVTLHDNELWDYAIAAEGDIIVDGGMVVVTEGGAVSRAEQNGLLYSYGTFPEGNRFDHKELGGIIVGFDSTYNTFLDDYSRNIDNGVRSYITDDPSDETASLQVAGKVISHSGLIMNHEGSYFRTTEDLYVNDLIVNAFDRQTTDNPLTIAVDGSVYAMEDIIVDGNHVDMVIGDPSGQFSGEDYPKDAYGNYNGNGVIWGLMDKDGSDNGAKDRASAMIVRGDASYVSITANRFMIAGIAYIDMYRTAGSTNVYYMTGETFTTEDYRWFYGIMQDQLAQTSVLATFQDAGGNEVFAVEYSPDGTIANMEPNPEVEGKEGQNPTFKSEHFMLSAGANNDPPNSSNIDSSHKNIFNVRGFDSSDPDQLFKNYALGVILSDDKLHNPNKMAQATTFGPLQREAVIRIDDEMNFLRTRDYTTLTNEENRLQELVDITKTEIIDTDSDNAIRIVTDKDVWINKPADVIPSGDYVLLEDKTSVQGVVATSGHVYLYAPEGQNLNFTGNIAAGGSVILYGEGTKTIEANKERVINTVAGDYNTIKAYFVDTKGGQQQGKQVIALDPTQDNSLANVVRMDVVENSTVHEVSFVESPEMIGVSKKKTKRAYQVEEWKTVTR